MTNTNVDTSTQEQRDLIERLETAYNSVDHYLRNQLRSDRNTSFRQLVKQYAIRFPRWREEDFLSTISELRNFVVHNHEKPYQHLAVPARSAVEDLERISKQFNEPEMVFSRYGKVVTSFQTDEVLSRILREISAKGYSQFPIYQRNQFLGLLTENGITRWLANHSTNQMTLIELDEVIIKDILNQEEQRTNYQFISRNTTMVDAVNCFVLNALLEALLITEKGKEDEKLIGIITRWDMLSLKNDLPNPYLNT